jgi:hypothetical protein
MKELGRDTRRRVRSIKRAMGDLILHASSSSPSKFEPHPKWEAIHMHKLELQQGGIVD